LPAHAPPAPPPPAPRPAATARQDVTRAPPAAAATTSALPSPVPPVALKLAEIADTGALSLERAGPRGAWLAFCRQSKTPHLELAVGASSSESIDDLLGWDRSGRFVVVRQAGVVSLVDVATGGRTNLSALGFDDRDDSLDYRQHRALAFDPRGELLAFVRKGEPSTLVLYSLALGQERALGGIGGLLWRVAWDESGDTLVVSSVTEDTTKNGRLDFPVRGRKGARVGCSGVLPRFRASAETGDRPLSVLVSRDGSRVVPAPSFVAPFGAGYLARNVDGALSLERPGVTSQRLTDADCGARVVLADPTRNLALVACTNDKLKPKRLGLELVGPGYRQQLGIVIQPMAMDRWPDPPTRLVPLYPGSEVMLLDLDTKKLVALRPGDRVLATSGTRAVVRRDRTLVWLDATTGSETPLVADIEPFATLVVEGSLVAVGGAVVDASLGVALGRVTGRPLALTPAGDVLLAEGAPPSADAFARGPLRWHAPTPEPGGSIPEARPAPTTKTPPGSMRSSPALLPPGGAVPKRRVKVR
jgi:hypothetical protein